MKTIILPLMVVFCIAAMSTAEPINLLIITGGHDFERDEFFAAFDSFDNIQWTEIQHPQVRDFWGTDQIKEYDALLFYDMPKEISSEQKESFLDLVEDGMGIVFMHHSLASYPDWSEYMKIIGGHYHQKPYVTARGDTLVSTYKHDVDLTVNVEKEHPVTQDVNNFTIHDEVYNYYSVVPTVTPLLSTEHPESGELLAWTHTYKKSTIVYLLLGHDHHAYVNENFRKLVHNAVTFVADK